MKSEKLRRLALILEKHSKNPDFDPFYDLSDEDKEFLKEMCDREEASMKDERDSQGYVDWVNNKSN